VISKLNIVSQKVLDQNETLEFYVNKLGLEVAQDFQQGPVQWLTVRAPFRSATDSPAGEGPAGGDVTGPASGLVQRGKLQ
jgi:catechol 2,3-dioxygenase-like lactoylglutathione lyase family enzyme